MVLGISTNTRLLGLAIISEGCLQEYFIRLDKSPWSPTKADKIVSQLEPCVRQYCIKKVILSSPHAYHQTTANEHLQYCIRTYFEAQQIPVVLQTPQAFYSLCPAGEKKTKKAVLKALVSQFPQLTYCYQKELRNKKRYYMKLFEAVAAAMSGE